VVNALDAWLLAISTSIAFSEAPEFGVKNRVKVLLASDLESIAPFDPPKKEFSKNVFSNLSEKSIPVMAEE